MVLLPRAGLKMAQSEQFEAREENEFGATYNVALPEPTGLLQEAKHPFQAVLAHPTGRLLLPHGKKIKSGSHSDHHWHTKAVSMLVHPFFLLGCAQTDPENVEHRLIDHVD